MEKVKAVASLAEQAYSLLKKAIITGQLVPEKELPEEKLASDLGVSRTPLREAVQRLAMEGLIVLNKGKPATVATFTKESSLEFMELRKVLEIYNIEKVVSRCDANLLEELDENLGNQLKAISNDDFQMFIDLDRKFHLILASKNENEKIKKLIYEMNTGVNRAFLLLSNTVSLSAKDAYEEHIQIVRAIKKNNLESARNEMVRHFKNIETRFLTYFEREE